MFYSHFSKILSRCSEEPHFIIALCSTLIFGEHHPTITSKAKYETAVQNSAKHFSSYEKIKKMLFLQYKNTTYM